MAKTELDEILLTLKNRQDFKLIGGAGSGKSHTLILLIKKILEDNPDSNIVCITYTNVAVDRIKNSINNDKLIVTTIHSYLWSVIKRFQNEIISIIKNYDILDLTNIMTILDGKEELNICYSGYINTNNNPISIDHNLLIKISYYLFKDYKKLVSILINSIDYVFIDEYQDTSDEVIEIFLKFLKRDNKILVGLFGDPMQRIYRPPINNDLINKLKYIHKRENYRNPKKIIDLANKVRTDNLKEVISSERDEEGSVKFIYGDRIEDIDRIKNTSLFKSWNFNDSKDVKELRLTHNLNAKKMGFENLLNKYKRIGMKESLLSINIDEDKEEGIISRDPILSLLDKLYYIIYYYKNGNYRKFLSKTNFEINSLGDKKEIYKKILDFEEFFNDKNRTINEVIEKAINLKITGYDGFKQFITSKKGSELWKEIKLINIIEYIKSRDYLDEKCTIATQHSIKGDEFNNVLLILDNGKWFTYDFINVFSYYSKNKYNEKFELVNNLFYVCITRAKKELVIYMPIAGNNNILSTMKNLLGEENIYNVNSILENEYC